MAQAIVCRGVQFKQMTILTHLFEREVHLSGFSATSRFQWCFSVLYCCFEVFVLKRSEGGWIVEFFVSLN